MNSEYQGKTDLALEEKESFPGDGGEISGVILEEIYNEENNLKITKVIIKNETGAKAMRKPVGTYITLECDTLTRGGEDKQQKLADELSKYIQELLPEGFCSILAVGLGNQELTADSLGPKTLSQLWMTRHLYSDSEKDDSGNMISQFDNKGLSGMIPGVMGQTGMEACEIIRGVVNETNPDVVIVIDALAARSISRLGTTIQLTDTGIQPGSGVGNHRNALTKESLGVPVIAIGVPTVVGATTIACDTLDSLMEVLSRTESTQGISNTIKEFSPDEKFGLVKELLEPKFGPMYVTPKDMDCMIKKLSMILAEGISLISYN